MNNKINIKKYRLQTEMENLKIGNVEWFKSYVIDVLELRITEYLNSVSKNT